MSNVGARRSGRINRVPGARLVEEEPFFMRAASRQNKLLAAANSGQTVPINKADADFYGVDKYSLRWNPLEESKLPTKADLGLPDYLKAEQSYDLRKLLRAHLFATLIVYLDEDISQGRLKVIAAIYYPGPPPLGGGCGHVPS